MLAKLDLGGRKHPQWIYWTPDEKKFIHADFLAGIKLLQETREIMEYPLHPHLLPPFGGTKIMCVGRNYKPHVEELGNDIPKEPLWFTKPPSSLVPHQGKVILPQGVGRIDYEGEMAIVIGQQAHKISPDQSLSMIAGVTLALDITARDLQKTDGQWTRAKGFDTFCPLGPFIVPFSLQWLEADLKTELNGTVVQSDTIRSLIFPVPELIAHLSQCMTLQPGDIILTGTPAGVGPIKSGDRLKVTLTGPTHFSLEVDVE